MLVTAETSQFPIGWLKNSLLKHGSHVRDSGDIPIPNRLVEGPVKIFRIFVTRKHSNHRWVGWKNLASKNICFISVTDERSIPQSVDWRNWPYQTCCSYWSQLRHSNSRLVGWMVFYRTYYSCWWLRTFQFPTGWLNGVLLNILAMLETEETSQSLIDWLNDDWKNIDPMLVTEDTFQFPMGWLKEEAIEHTTHLGD